MNLYTKLAETVDQNRCDEAKQRFERYEFQRITSEKASRIMRKLGFKDTFAEQTSSGRQRVKATFLGHRIILSVHPDGSVMFLPPAAPLGSSRDWIMVNQDLSDLPTIIKTSLATAIERGLKPKGN